MTKICCLILNYNDSDTTIQLLDILMNYEAIYKIVVVDNCSSDDSFKKLSGYHNEKIVLLRADKNGGYGYGNNYGIKYICEVLHAAYFILMNPDTLITEQTIIKLVDFLDSNREYVLAAPVQRLKSQQGEIAFPWKLGSVWNGIFTNSIFISKLFHLDLRYKQSDIEENTVLDVDVVQGALFAANTEFMYKYGKYDENIFLYNEEECIAQKIKKNKRKSALLCKEIYIHNHSTSINKSIKSLVKQKKIKEQSRKIYLEKYYTMSLFQKIVMQIIMKIGIAEIRIYSAIRKI
ncbi:glycosyltransferase family 2 protein [Erysipelotrichaceae bacterium Oil+RF-744-GAM-WT-6]|uniref:Glycosyltransferase family 2 protein n=1 Tax=Stecheria intestinalis TaxID=2606630 RepID=A0A7X2NTZ8_9FIRM|nr:glycosyltransferase [Stecheria intestinalis]MSS59519.1 glycosyltransferase family 2 protein [Stecheria intestinalis]